MIKNRLMIFLTNIKIKYKFIIFFCMTIFVFIGFTNYLMFKKSSEYINKKIAETYLLQITQSNNNIDFILNSYERIANYFFLNKEFKTKLSNEYNNISDQLDARTAILNYISSLTLAYDLLPNTKIYTYNNSIIIDNDLFFDIDSFQNKSWLDEINEMPKMVRLCRWLKPYKVVQDNTDRFYIGEAALIEADNRQKIALICLELDVVKLFEFLNTNSKNMREKNEVLLTDDKGDIIYSTDKSLITRNIGNSEFFLKASSNTSKGYFNSNINGKNKLVVYDNNIKNNWKLFNIIDDIPLPDETRNIMNFTVILALSAIAFSIIVTYFYVGIIIKRILELTQAMTKVRDGNFNVNTGITGSDEIGTMNQVFLNMVRETKKLMQQIKDTEKAKHRLELISLQEQIKPHFLYNSFSAIGKMALSVEANDIYSAILSLSQYYKISLSQGQDVITIADEIKHINAYINLLNLRFNNKFNIVYEIDESIFVYYTPKLILQPIIENSFFHGFNKKMDYPGNIKIKLEKEDTSIIFEITDDGVGMSDEKVKQILESKSEGYALKNIDTRIKLICGNDFGLELESSPGEGTTTRITIPIIQEDFER